MKCWALLLCAALLWMPVAHAQPLPSADLHVQALDALLGDVEARNAGIGSVSVFKEGREIYARHIGQQYLPDADHDDDSGYQIASVTKMVTAILAFRLIEDGRLSLQDKLADFLPDMPAAQTISIEQLLAHTSGLGNFAIKDGVVWVVDPQTQDDILAEIKRQGVSFPAGERVAYSNSAYFLLRMILEQKYGRAYHQIVADELATPLGLHHFTGAGAHPDNTFGSYVFDGTWAAIKDIDYSNVVGVGDIASTTRDLTALVVALFQGRILRPETLAQMQPIAGHDGWGRGLAEFNYAGQRFVGHGGDVLGSHSRVIYNPADSVAITWSTNGERIATNVLLEAMVDALYGRAPELPPLR